MKCDGNCDKHKGQVKPVIVRSTGKSPDPYLISEDRFNYCEAAIKKDRKNGYEVKEL